MIFPFRMQQGYLESMAGATYCVMPSLHEPFGAATEPYLQGSPVVAHATGGLVQQVVDARQNPAEATGILYRPQEVGTAEQQGRQWRAVLDSPDPASRMHFPLYVSLVHGLAAALTEAVRIFQNDKQLYGRNAGPPVSPGHEIRLGPRRRRVRPDLRRRRAMPADPDDSNPNRRRGTWNGNAAAGLGCPRVHGPGTGRRGGHGRADRARRCRRLSRRSP